MLLKTIGYCVFVILEHPILTSKGHVEDEGGKFLDSLRREGIRADRDEWLYHPPLGIIVPAILCRVEMDKS